MQRIAIAMQDGGAGAGARHEAAARARGANLILSCRRTSIWTPVGGTFGFKFSSRPHPWKFGVKRFLMLREVLARKWGGLFWATSVEKIIGGVTAIVSYRTDGWMQQSPCGGVLSFRWEARESLVARFNQFERI